MLRIFIDSSSFEIIPIQDKQNPYIDITYNAKKHKRLILSQYNILFKSCTVYPTILYKLPNEIRSAIPDIVFCANAGLSLPRFGKPLVLLPSMKYSQRRDELPYLKQMYKLLGISTINYPGKEVFEGQAELKWFHGGTKAVCGYGYRSTKKTFSELNNFFKHIYGVNKPDLLVLPLASSYYYHLDVAMLEYSDKKCIVHKHAFSPVSLHRLQHFLGHSNVTIIDTKDTFCLNAIVDGKNIITHKLTPSDRKIIESTGYTIKEVDTSEFKKSGGSARCMALDIYLQ